MRFTDKKGRIIYWWHKRNDPVENEYKQDLANQKLMYLEDIEEELGIDLVILFKALTDGIWYKKEEHSLRTGLCLSANKEWTIVCWLTKYECAYCSLKDYGKTWALTREELENE